MLSRYTLATLLLIATLLLSTANAEPQTLNRRGGSRMPSRKGERLPDTNSGRRISEEDDSKNPVCKKWYPIRDAILTDIFGGVCGNEARAAVRLAFHDAGTYSQRLERQGRPNGGADGSMLSDPSEAQRRDNNGLQGIIKLLQPLPARFGVSNGDILHLAGILGVIVCPGGPPIRTWIGRRNQRNKNPEGMLPNVRDEVPKMLERFADMGFTTRDAMALIGAHSTAKQRFVDPSRAGQSQDSTPHIWDVKFYGETKNRSTPEGVFKFASDVKFANHPLSRRDFERFIDDQDDWDEDYAAAHEKMSLLGQDRSRMTDCTEVLPPKIDLGPLFVDKDAGEDSDEDTGPRFKVDRERLDKVFRRLRGKWMRGGSIPFGQE